MDDAAMSSARLSVSSGLRQKLHWLGSGLAIIGVVFVAIRLRAYWIDLDFSRVTLSIWLSIAVFAMLYGLANLLLASAWWHLLIHFGAPVTKAASVKIYGVSQLAKYLPGNIFHLAGRQALGMAAGISAGVLAKSTLWELGLIALTGTLFGWLILPIFFPAYPKIASTIILLGSAWLTANMLKRFAGRETTLAFIWQILFLATSGGIFVALLGIIAGSEVIPAKLWLMIGGAYIVAWLAGLVTPGAPAGVGVREMILLLLLKGMIHEADLLMAILLGRLVTVAGDLLFFISAFFTSTTK
jgi:glycosyltransferase 2 family protein